MTGHNMKAKYLMCQIPTIMLKQHSILHSSLQKLRFIHQKGIVNLWIMYVANSAILELWIFSGRYHFRLWVFASTGENFYCWHWRVLPKLSQDDWCQDL